MVAPLAGVNVKHQPPPQVWWDFVADTGDGGDPTYA